jgi:hypothetical protein
MSNLIVFFDNTGEYNQKAEPFVKSSALSIVT